ncbi:Uncharacterised protein [Actinomyces howellii]|uniref:DUF4241 domain-containing protein n=1 Tax=Actinomyces howellii TaxID=52771 RepID=A0A448HHL6_9ACTO|nr:Uncharacterised protein [Actinomyces howellii]
MPSGRVEACDPFVTLGEGPVYAVEPGDYPVRVTVADVSPAQDGSHLREAYLSIVLADGEAASVEEAETVNGDDGGVGVDAGTVGFADHEAVSTAMPSDGVDWYEELFDSGEPDSWFELMDSTEHFRAGAANIVMPLAENGENVVLSHSGWGDGFYPVVLTRDADGSPLGLHIDLQVVGRSADHEDED